MTDSVAQRIEALSAQLEGLETAADGLDDDPAVAVSVRRIARSLETAAKGLELGEIAAGAMAIQRAADAHLARSVSNFLARIAELWDEAPPDEATILIVEDNETVATATKAYLKAEGRALLMAESAAQALSILADRRPGDPRPDPAGPGRTGPAGADARGRAHCGGPGDRAVRAGRRGDPRRVRGGGRRRVPGEAGRSEGATGRRRPSDQPGQGTPGCTA